ncbi:MULTISPECIES: N-acetylmuramic acid 6-phosphate etherase [Anaerococcus]|uniref:N-acetylmuramic acid 6-phosphate etherase n=1 Tax=Anaerococcus porci TaxID=2652269 RepID=A0A6N7VRR5_9FIRM|nr:MULTISPECIES: N-acetylmuramic acid 6-phosphate etherase [Anaerococcus]MDY3006041.1 N-acetylmuramic acid 6-phosphate etherase [Anaerococcus porci]MSS77566.1 N-acetylmuramic acid 6-phosphate etherase [Anaerococcus porci]
MPSTENRNINSKDLDLKSTREIIEIINKEDQSIAKKVGQKIGEIEKLVDELVRVLNRGGRLFYIGAGTSGRLGVLDASEALPTFSVNPNLINGIIAGGDKALRNPVENAEDNEEMGKLDLIKNQFTKEDMLVGIASSGRTPYVIGALKYAREIGASTGSLSCNLDSLISKYADCPIEVDTGSEILTGSTRMKAGTATKMVLNIISTTAMVRIGKVYDNLMVDVRVSNKKLRKRAISIIKEVCEVDEKRAEKLLNESQNSVKCAILMGLKDIKRDEALNILKENDGFLRRGIQ